MKAIEANAANISISVAYCFFGILSFFVFKIAAKYFTNKKDPMTEQLDTQTKKMIEQKSVKVNFPKIFLKKYFTKNTFAGSFFNQDKKYLLKEIFILSCIAVCCLKINAYVIWPWAVGLSLSCFVSILSQIIIPIIENKQKGKMIYNRFQKQIKPNSVQDEASLQIEQTDLQLSLSINRDGKSQKSEAKIKPKQNIKTEILEKAEICFSIILAIISEILICQCILTLSLSVSNSGVLNIVSFGMAVAIDQIVCRCGLGLLSSLILFTLHKMKCKRAFENSLFYAFCYEQILEEIKLNGQQKSSQVVSNHVESQVNSSVQHQESNDQIINPATVFEQLVENQVSESEKKSQTINAVALLEQQHQIQIQPVYEVNVDGIIEIPKTQQPPKQIKTKTQQTNYFQLFAHDVEMFEQKWTERTKPSQKPSKIRKQPLKPKFKSDPLLFFPYEECKQSHRGSIQHQMKQNQETIIFSREKSTIEDNFLSNIQVLDCIDDTITSEQPQIGMVLYDKNMNLKTMTINEKPQILPTSRPDYSQKKRSNSTINMKKIKKVSPYLVDLPSEAVRPQKSKKISIIKKNKENANEGNHSFLPSQNIDISGCSQTNQNFINSTKKIRQNHVFNVR